MVPNLTVHTPFVWRSPISLHTWPWVTSSLAPPLGWSVPFPSSNNKLDLSQEANAFIVIMKKYPSIQGILPACTQSWLLLGQQDLGRCSWTEHNLYSHIQQPRSSTYGQLSLSPCPRGLTSLTPTHSHMKVFGERLFKILQASTHGIIFKKRIKTTLCFICGSDVCLYIHFKRSGGIQSEVFQSKLKVRLEGWEFYFILCFFFFIRDIYNSYNVIFLRKKNPLRHI